jgi:hypothetical protein
MSHADKSVDLVLNLGRFWAFHKLAFGAVVLTLAVVIPIDVRE